MKPLVIFDLDGTLSDAAHRRHLVEGEKRYFDKFYDECYKDGPMLATFAVARGLHATGHELWVFSGRTDRVAVLTATWFIKHEIAHLFSRMQFRPEGDYTPDDQLKLQWFEQMSRDDRHRLVLTFDDRDRMVKMWRSLGVTCFQVAAGDF